MPIRLITICGLLVLAACGEQQDGRPPADIAMAILSSSGTGDAGYLRADQTRDFRFPRDHGRHDGYRTEWWYVTGNLRAEGRQFGYQLTFFRVLVEPEAADGPDSVWQTRAVWLAQAALTDISGERFYTAERFSREAPGLARAADDHLQVRVLDWLLTGPEPAVNDQPIELQFDAGEFAVRLQLQSLKPVVLQGDAGLSIKSAADSGNASYYYSITRLETTGSVRLDDVSHTVSGESWLDREWSTSALAPEQAGWDWFALQFDNGAELMLYRLRLRGGGVDPASAGVLVDQQGRVRKLSADDFTATPLSYWYSAHTQRSYPLRWHLISRPVGVELEVEASLDNQEWTGRLQYWEGAVRARGRWHGSDINGRGYMELTGYE